jgi:hypothetical protein
MPELRHIMCLSETAIRDTITNEMLQNKLYLNVALIVLIQITALEHTTSQKQTSAVGYRMDSEN